MPKRATGIEVGARSAIALAGHVKGNTFAVTDYSFQAIAPGKDAYSEWDPGFAPKGARVGISGKDVNVRYIRVPRLPDWQLRKLMRFEVAEVGDSSASAVAADFNLLPEMAEVEGEDTVLLAMVRESALERPQSAVAELGGDLDAFSPAAIGLYNAWLRFGVVMEDTVLLAHLGHDSTDVVLVRGADLVYARNLSGGTDFLETAILERMGVSAPRAAALLLEEVDLSPQARLDGDRERATRAAQGAAGQILGLLQSVGMFARTQVKLSNLKLDRVFLSGRGARVRGLDRYLQSALSVPVERFDPFRVVDVSALEPQAAAELERHREESVVALGLASAGSDPNAYAVDILPAALERRRNFRQRTAFLLVAAALAVVFLGWDAWRQRGMADQLGAEARRLQQTADQSARVHKRTEELVRQNAQLRQQAAQLLALASRGEQAARALEAVERSLPQNFWLTSLVARDAAEGSLGLKRGAEAPVVLIEGRAVEGVRERSVVFQEFCARLRESTPEFRWVETLSPDGARFTLVASAFAERPASQGEVAQ